MKAKFQHIAAATAMLMVAGAAQASDGSVLISGTVRDGATCNIVQGGGVNTITLDTLPASQFATAGDKGGYKPFVIEVSGCSYDSEGFLQMYFEAGAAVDPLTGNLKNTATQTAATNVELEITDVEKSLKILPGKLNAQGLAAKLYSSDGTAKTFNYTVNYVSTGVATAGAVTSQVTYSIWYN